MHLAWHIFTVHWMLVYLIVCHISPHMLVLHGPLESLTRILTTAETHQHTPMQLNSPREQIFNKLYACLLIHIFISCAIIMKPNVIIIGYNQLDSTR